MSKYLKFYRNDMVYNVFPEGGTAEYVTLDFRKLDSRPWYYSYCSRPTRPAHDILIITRDRYPVIRLYE